MFSLGLTIPFPTDFDELVKMMVAADMELAERERALIAHDSLRPGRA